MHSKTQPDIPEGQASREDSPERLRTFAERSGIIAHDLNNMLGTMIGTNITTRTSSDTRLLMRQQPIAQSVPATTASAVEPTAMRKDCQIEPSHSGEASTVP